MFLELKDEIEQKEKRISDLRAHIQKLNAEVTELRDIKKSFEPLRKQLDGAMIELSASQKKCMAQEEAIAQWSEVVEQKDKRIAEIEKHLAEKELFTKAAQFECDLKSKEADQLTKDLELVKLQLGEREEQIKRLQTQFDEYQKAWGNRISGATEEKDQLRQKTDELMNQLEKIEHMMSLREAKEEFQDQLDKLDLKHKMELESQATHARQKYSNCMEQLVESNRERERTEREAKHFKKIESETKREIHEIKVQFELYKRENEIKDLLEVKFDIDAID